MANQTKHTKAHEEAHEHGPGRYVVIWLLLLVATITTVVTGRLDLGAANLPLAMVIATIKATLVVLFFMHLWDSEGINRLVFGVSILFVMVLMLGVFGDLFTRMPMSLPPNAPSPALEQGLNAPELEHTPESPTPPR